MRKRLKDLLEIFENDAKYIYFEQDRGSARSAAKAEFELEKSRANLIKYLNRLEKRAYKNDKTQSSQK